MGVIHKLKPQIKEFILDKKKEKSILSCRGLSVLVEKKFKIKVSKSSINSLLKTSSLSMPVGRRRKTKRKGSVTIADNLGAILLKAADSLLGGTEHIFEAVKNKPNLETQDLLPRIEYFLYRNLFDLNRQTESDWGLWQMINLRLESGALSSYLIGLQNDTELVQQIAGIIKVILFKEVRALKITLAENSFFYLDGQFHTIWSASHIPPAFSATYHEITGYIKEYFQQNNLIVFFMAPGYDAPTKEFFDFILSLDFVEKKLCKLTLYGSKFEELESIPLDQTAKRYCVFGLWPWQFGEYRKIKPIKEFRPFYSEAFKENVYIGDTMVELLQPNVNKSVILRGCALKLQANEKAKFIILSNLPVDKVNQEQLADIYLSKWPNLEETFQDFSRKIDLFTYTASSQHFFPTETLSIDKEAQLGLEKLFSHYLLGLDLYVKWHFLPSGCEKKDFATLKEQFYSLKARMSWQKDRLLVSFRPEPDYAFLRELQYACRRINERRVLSRGEKRIFCRVD